MNLSNDDVLLSRLAEAVDTADPLPDAARAMAKAIPSLSRIDAELAALLEQSSLAGAGVRADASVADLPLIFESPTLAVAVEFDPDLAVDIVVGPVGVTVDRVEVELRTGNRIVADSTDESGRYRPAQPVAGPARVVVTTTGGPTVMTDWFTVA